MEAFLNTELWLCVLLFSILWPVTQDWAEKQIFSKYFWLILNYLFIMIFKHLSSTFIEAINKTYGKPEGRMDIQSNKYVKLK